MRTLDSGMSTGTASARDTGTARPSHRRPTAGARVVVVVAVAAIGLLTLGAGLLFRQISVTQAERVDQTQLYVAEMASGTVSRLPTDSDQAYWGPAWSPDGRWLAYTLIPLGEIGGPVYLAAADGSDAHQLTSGPRAGYLVAWAPDSSQLAFLGQFGSDESTADLFVINVDGSGQRQLTANSAQEYGASWSPDGERIAFGSKQDGTWRVYVMQVDGSGQAVVPNTEQGNAPSWSPDGDRLLFTSDRTGNDSIYVVDLDGSNLTRLTNNPHHNDNAVWSPDARRIAFSSDRDGKNDIFVMDSDGSNQINLTHDLPIWADIPGWSADATRIILHASDRSESVLWPFQVARGAVVVLHAAILMSVVVMLLARGITVRGALGLIGLLAGLILGLLLQSPWLGVAVVIAGLAADTLMWGLAGRSSSSRAKLVAIGAAVPVLLYGVPTVEEVILDPANFPLPIAVATVLIAAAAGGATAGVMIARTEIPA